jgi:hypothetical protein
MIFVLSSTKFEDKSAEQVLFSVEGCHQWEGVGIGKRE